MPSDVMTANELRDRTNEELVSFVQEKSEELFKLRFQHYTGQLENTARLKVVRRELARARTILTERDKGIDVPVRARVAAAEAPAEENPAEAKETDATAKEEDEA